MALRFDACEIILVSAMGEHLGHLDGCERYERSTLFTDKDRNVSKDLKS